jgi:hypothetical protein
MLKKHGATLAGGPTVSSLTLHQRLENWNSLRAFL